MQSLISHKNDLKDRTFRKLVAFKTHPLKSSKLSNFTFNTYKI